MDYLSFEASPYGVRASPNKVRAVVEWPSPKDVNNVCSFLGLAKYYKKFIHGFSEIARPLTDLTQAAKEFDWKEPQQSAFIQLKMALATAPISLIPDFELPQLKISVVITTDARGSSWCNSRIESGERTLACSICKQKIEQH